jgi:hypothetical protein
MRDNEAKMFEKLEGRILGKFCRPHCKWPSRSAQSSLVTKTKVPLENILWGEGEVIADGQMCRI